MTTRISTLMIGLAVAIAPLTACKKDSAPPTKSDVQAPPPPANASRVAITVTDKGFEPGKVTVKQGVPTTLVFTRKTDNTCIKEVVFEIDPDHKIRKDLPLNTPVEIAATFPKAGDIRYACGMDMMSGTFTVQ